MPPNNKYKELNINKIAFFLNMEVYANATCSSKFLIFQLKLKFDENLIQLNRVQQTTANWRKSCRVFTLSRKGTDIHQKNFNMIDICQDT